MKIHDVQQNSLEWLALRAGCVTASEFHRFMKTDFTLRDGEMVHSYLAQKLAEWWTGGAIAGYCSIDMEAGKILEEEAIPELEWDFNWKIDRVGFVSMDDAPVGCSPDGLIGDDGGIEAKCPISQTHVKYLLRNEVPSDYIQQVHGSLYVTGRKWWKFMSYCRRFPRLLIHVERDEEIMAQIGRTISAFLAKFQAGKSKLIELNGGRMPIQRSLPKIEPITEPLAEFSAH